jgi:hypothetical protein
LSQAKNVTQDTDETETQGLVSLPWEIKMNVLIKNRLYSLSDNLQLALDHLDLALKRGKFDEDAQRHVKMAALVVGSMKFGLVRLNRCLEIDGHAKVVDFDIRSTICTAEKP